MPSRRSAARFAAATLALWVGVSSAADRPGDDAGLAELEDLLSTPVYAASKFMQRAADAPATVTVLTAGDIRTFGWRTLADVLAAVRGVHIRNDQGYDYVGVRGFGRPGDYSSRLLLLIDGVRANENIYDAAMVSREFPLDVGLIERVEFVAGPGSALYGTNAVFGVVNVITRSAASLRGDQVTVTAGTDGTKVFGTSSREGRHGTLLLSATREHRPGEDRHYAEFDDPSTNHGVATGRDAEDDAKVYGRYTGGDWVVSALASQRTKQIPNAAYGTVFNDPATEWRDTFASADATWQHALDARHGLYANVGVGHYDYTEVARYEPERFLERYRDTGQWVHGEARWTARLDGHAVVVGGELQRDVHQRTRSWRLVPDEGQTFDADSAGLRAGVYASDEFDLRPGLKLALGARVDKREGRDPRLTPRAALLWWPAPEAVVKLMTGAAHRDPNVYESRPNVDGLGVDPNLRREEVRSQELAVDWRASEGLRVSGSLFHTHIDDLIDQVSDDATGELVYRNVGAARATGLELEAEAIGEAGWRLRGSWTAQRLHFTDGRPATNAPNTLLKLHGVAPLPRLATRVGLEVLGMGPRRTLGGQGVPGHVVVNATLQHDPVGRPWSLAFSVYNLGDARVAEPGGPEHVPDVLFRTGRSAALSATWRF